MQKSLLSTGKALLACPVRQVLPLSGCCPPSTMIKSLRSPKSPVYWRQEVLMCQLPIRSTFSFKIPTGRGSYLLVNLEILKQKWVSQSILKFKGSHNGSSQPLVICSSVKCFWVQMVFISSAAWVTFQISRLVESLVVALLAVGFCRYVYEYWHISAGAHRGQKRM